MNWRVTARRSIVQTSDRNTYVVPRGMGGTVQGAVRMGTGRNDVGVRVAWDRAAVVNVDEKLGYVGDGVVVDSPADALEDRGSL